MQVEVPDPDPVHEKGWIRLLLNAVPGSDFLSAGSYRDPVFCRGSDLYHFFARSDPDPAHELGTGSWLKLPRRGFGSLDSAWSE